MKEIAYKTSVLMINPPVFFGEGISTIHLKVRKKGNGKRKKSIE
jgi:hypothetical protein